MKAVIRLPFICMLVILFWSPRADCFAELAKNALVIGNSAYTTARLINPVNDAKDIAYILSKLGFKVTLKTNATQRVMERAIRDFGRNLRKGGVGLFYFAGHGIQVKGSNYLIPIGAVLESEGDIKYEAVDAGLVLAKMEDAGNGLNIVILDACRNNPFSRSFRSAETGLAKMDAPRGSILAYATAPGSIAADGTGRNGLYTAKLLKHMVTPNLKIEEVFKRVRIDVASDSGNKQTPWESSSLMGDFYFTTSRGIKVTAKNQGLKENQKNSAEMLFWESVRDSQDIKQYQLYIDQFPNGTYTNLASFYIEKYKVPRPNDRVKYNQNVSTKNTKAKQNVKAKIGTDVANRNNKIIFLPSVFNDRPGATSYNQYEKAVTAINELSAFKLVHAYTYSQDSKKYEILKGKWAFSESMVNLDAVKSYSKGINGDIGIAIHTYNGSGAKQRINVYLIELKSWEAIQATSEEVDCNMILNLMKKVISKSFNDYRAANLNSTTNTEYNTVDRLPLNIYTSQHADSFIPGRESLSIEAIAAVVSNDERLNFKFSYKKPESEAIEVTLLKDILGSEEFKVWGRKTLFSEPEPDWEEIKRISHEIDANLIYMMSGDIMKGKYWFYLYDTANNKIYSKNARARGANFKNDVQAIVRNLTNNYFSETGSGNNKPFTN